ncbi:MAG: LysR family transcriptional regulator [Erysipelotrichaceae bacterium]|nr:LysR family transcriptional regulator [Erysipelotrichaceae bacterium]
MLSKYGIICEVAKCGSFSKVAEKYGYAQSSISQAIKSLEEEYGLSLIERKRHSIKWSKDGEIFKEHFLNIYNNELEIEKKINSLKGLEKAVIRIGTFTSVSRNILPSLMTTFKLQYPDVSFELHQGDYNNIREWLENGDIDLGFISSEMVSDLNYEELYSDEMLAVLPLKHPLNKYKKLSLEQLAEDTFILLDEGEYSTTLTAFEKQNLKPNVEYKIYDDYSILSMVKNRLGISILFKNVIKGFEEDVSIHELKTPIKRTICLAYSKNKDLSYSSKKFRDFTIEEIKNII